MNFSKQDIKRIYETNPARITIEPNKRFIGKEFGECGNHVLVDDEKTNIMICLKCRDDSSKQKSMFFVVSAKNELSNTKAHYQNNHLAAVDKLKRSANQSTIGFPVEKRSRNGQFTETDLMNYRQKIAIAIAKSNVALDFMENEGADKLLEAFLGKSDM